MKLRIVGIVYLAALLFFCTGAFAQPYRKLTPNDFRGVAHTNGTAVIAFTNCSVEYSYTAKRENNYYVLSFNIHLIMNSDQSFIDRSRVTTPALLAEVLKHEQGHYNIAFMEQQELLRTVSHTVFYANYHAVADAIFDRIEAKYKQLNTDYDNDTQNSTNRVQQQSWDTYFAKKLEYMPPV